MYSVPVDQEAAAHPQSARRFKRRDQMRILIHDYSGHPFQLQLSRSLASRGYQVLHLCSGSIPTPQAVMSRKPSDPASIQVNTLSIGKPVAKYSYARRFVQELAYARLLEKAAKAYAPDIVICSNSPIDIASRLARFCRSRSVPWIFWLQDLYSVAIERYLSPKVPILGRLASIHYTRREGQLLGSARFVVAISDGFVPMLRRFGCNADHVVVIENWAPLDEIAPVDKGNSWAAAQGLDSAFCFLYSGTIGLKHNPQRLVQLAQHFSDDANVRVVVVSEGKGAEYLAEAKQRLGLANLVLLPWQPFEELPNVLGTSDVLLALLEPDAGVLSVPSKVLSNLAAGRPQLLAVPTENLAAETVCKARAGLVAAPDDKETWLRHAESLYRDADLRRDLANNARNYALGAFDIDPITDRFEELIRRSLP